jgi:protein SCO1/2
MSKNKWFLLPGSILLGLLAAFAVWQAAGALRRPQFRGGAFEVRAPAPDFTLTGDTGEPVRLSQFRGKVVLLYFGYTFCPDVCPGTLVTLRRAFQMVGSPADRVQLLFVTVDPERDTPEKLHQYLDYFDPRFMGLAGTLDETLEVAHLFGVHFHREEGTAATGYLVSHSAGLVAIDSQGRLALSMPYGLTAEDIASDLRLLLAE